MPISVRVDIMNEFELSYNTRKALCVHLGEPAGMEVANLLQRLSARIEQLERTKVNVTPIAPDGTANLLDSRYSSDIS